MDDDVREIHGATPKAGATTAPITVRERDTSIAIYRDYDERIVLSAEGARFLAAKLIHLAYRIEKRGE